VVSTLRLVKVVAEGLETCRGQSWSAVAIHADWFPECRLKKNLSSVVRLVEPMFGDATDPSLFDSHGSLDRAKSDAFWLAAQTVRG